MLQVQQWASYQLTREPLRCCKPLLKAQDNWPSSDVLWICIHSDLQPRLLSDSGIFSPRSVNPKCDSDLVLVYKECQEIENGQKCKWEKYTDEREIGFICENDHAEEETWGYTNRSTGYPTGRDRTANPTCLAMIAATNRDTWILPVVSQPYRLDPTLS